MSYNNGSRIVTDGLIVYLDAANSKSYKTGNSTWYDLTKNNNNATVGSSVSLSNTFGGGLSFSNSAAASNMTIVGNASFSYTAWAFEIVISTSGSPGSDPTGIFGLIDSGGVTSNGFRSAGTYTQFSAGGSWVNLSAYNSSLNILSHRVITRTGTSLKQYNNGVLYSTDTMGSGTGTITTYAINSHGTFSAINSQDGIVYMLKIYNREMLAADVLQNYNAVKKRFGLS